VIEIVYKETGKDLDYIKNQKGVNRQISMEMLYCYAGLKGREIGGFIGLDYSTVSLGKKRLRVKMLNNNSLQNLVRRIEDSLSIIKI